MPVLEDHAVETLGSGDRTVILAHGFGCDKHMWNALVPLLSEDYRIVLYDLMGSGASDDTRYDRTRYASLKGHADDLIAILEALDLPTKPTLVGHSVSAMTVVLAANARPDLVEDVVMICPSPSFIDDAPYEGGFTREDILGLLKTLDANYLGWAGSMAPVIMGTPNDPEQGEALRESFCRADPEIAKHFAHVTFLSDHRKDVEQLDHRTLILECRDDAIVPPAVGRWMEGAVRKGKRVTLDATGHCPHISFPQETARAVRTFLEAS